MSLAIPKLRIEVFPEPVLFDDHFLKYGWTGAPVGGGINSDGDILSVIVQTGQSYQQAQLAIEFEPLTYPYFIFRVSDIAAGATCSVWVRRKSDGQWLKVSDDITSTGIFYFVISYVLTTTCDMILLQTAGSPNDYTNFDYVAICKSTFLTPAVDLTNSVIIDLPVLNEGIAGAAFTIPNMNAEYTGKIKKFDALIIWLTRTASELGTVAAKAFGGRVQKLTKRGLAGKEFYINIEAYGHGYELDKPPALITENWDNGPPGRYVIEACLDLLNYVVKHPLAINWFAFSAGGSDNRIGSLHYLNYYDEGKETTPGIIIKEILENAKNPLGDVGFDAYITPSGCMIGHLRNSLDFPLSPPQITLESYEYSEDVHQVINAQTVYGAKKKAYPTDRDSITEDVTKVGNTLEHADGVWTVYGGGSTIYKDTDKAVGSYCVRTNGGTGTGLVFTFNTPFNSNRYPSLVFQPKSESGYPYLTVELEDADGMLMRRALQINGTKYDLQDLKVGYRNADVWQVDLFNTQAFEWDRIQKIRFVISTTVGVNLRIDGLFFNQRPFSATVQDSASQTQFGAVRWGAPTTDESLESDVECELRAKSIIEMKKTVVITLKEVLTDGSLTYKPGNRVRITVSNDNIDLTIRAIKVRHEILAATWDSFLTLSHAARERDYLFREMAAMLRRLGRKI